MCTYVRTRVAFSERSSESRNAGQHTPTPTNSTMVHYHYLVHCLNTDVSRGNRHHMVHVYQYKSAVLVYVPWSYQVRTRLRHTLVPLVAHGTCKSCHGT
jgi:hypothetical protein